MLQKPSISAAVLAATVAFSGAVHADQSSGWSGGYFGIHGGISGGNYMLFSTDGDGVGIDVDGVVVGGTVGYNFQKDRIVYGVEADISTGPAGITPQGSSGPYWVCFTGDCNADIKRFGTVRGRIGFAQKNMLIYGTAGLAWGDVEGGIFNSVQQGGGTAYGWAAGLGAEYALNQSWSAKIEYMHVDLGDIPFGIDGSTVLLGRGDFQVLRLGLNTKF